MTKSTAKSGMKMIQAVVSEIWCLLNF